MSLASGVAALDLAALDLAVGDFVFFEYAAADEPEPPVVPVASSDETEEEFQATTIKILIDAGFEAVSAVQAVTTGDFTRLEKAGSSAPPVVQRVSRRADREREDAQRRQWHAENLLAVTGARRSSTVARSRPGRVVRRREPRSRRLVRRARARSPGRKHGDDPHDLVGGACVPLGRRAR